MRASRIVLPVCSLSLLACVSQPSSSTAPIALDFAESRLVRTDQVELYRCTEGLLIAERISSGQRRLTCGWEATPALLR